MQRILVVEDAQINRELLCEMLQDDYVVETAEDGEEALEKLALDGAGMAAVLLDLQMPKMDGFSVIEEMGKKGWIKKIPILVISGEYTVEAENRCFEMGVSDFIHKPFVDSIVKNRVRNALELFDCKNQLEQRVQEQEQTLREQYRIIQAQEEKLREAKPFNRLMMEYQAAIMEVETRLKVL